MEPTAQQLLDAVVQQRDQALNTGAQLFAQNAALRAEVERLKKLIPPEKVE